MWEGTLTVTPITHSFWRSGRAGWMHRSWKPAYVNAYRGFESLLLRKSNLKCPVRGIFYFLRYRLPVSGGVGEFFLPLVIPAKAVVRQAHHPEQRRRRIQNLFVCFTGCPPTRLCRNSKMTLNLCPSCRTWSGIQQCNNLKKHWIPGQARNDEKMNMQNSGNCDTLSCAGVTGRTPRLLS